MHIKGTFQCTMLLHVHRIHFLTSTAARDVFLAAVSFPATLNSLPHVLLFSFFLWLPSSPLFHAQWSSVCCQSMHLQLLYPYQHRCVPSFLSSPFSLLSLAVSREASLLSHCPLYLGSLCCNTSSRMVFVVSS